METRLIICDECGKELNLIFDPFYIEVRLKNFGTSNRTGHYCCFDCLKKAYDEAIENMKELTNKDQFLF